MIKALINAALLFVAAVLSGCSDTPPSPSGAYTSELFGEKQEGFLLPETLEGIISRRIPPGTPREEVVRSLDEMKNMHPDVVTLATDAEGSILMDVTITANNGRVDQTLIDFDFDETDRLSEISVLFVNYFRKAE